MSPCTRAGSLRGGPNAESPSGTARTSIAECFESSRRNPGLADVIFKLTGRPGDSQDGGRDRVNNGISRGESSRRAREKLLPAQGGGEELRTLRSHGERRQWARGFPVGPIETRPECFFVICSAVRLPSRFMLIQSDSSSAQLPTGLLWQSRRKLLRRLGTRHCEILDSATLNGPAGCCARDCSVVLISCGSRVILDCYLMKVYWIIGSRFIGSSWYREFFGNELRCLIVSVARFS